MKQLIKIETPEQQPGDFLVNKNYDQEILTVITNTTDLAYPDTEEGMVEAKAMATDINKFAGWVEKSAAAAYKAVTEEADSARKIKRGYVDSLKNNRQRILDQMQAGIDRKMESIRTAIYNQLAIERTALDVKMDYHISHEIAPLMKMSGTLTPGGSLTKAAGAVVYSWAMEEARLQTRQAIRLTTLENKCLRADINPPLTPVHMGNFWHAEDTVFEQALDNLISHELSRIAEQEERIKQKQAIENQRKIDQALREQQAEANRIAKAEFEAARAKEIAENPPSIDRAPDPAPVQVQSPKPSPVTDTQPGAGKKVVTVIVHFEKEVRESINPAAVGDYVLKNLPPELKSLVRYCSNE